MSAVLVVLCWIGTLRIGGAVYGRRRSGVISGLDGKLAPVGPEGTSTPVDRDVVRAAITALAAAAAQTPAGPTIRTRV